MADRTTPREAGGRQRRKRPALWPVLVAIVAVVGTAGFLNLEPAAGDRLPDGLPLPFHAAFYRMLRLYTVDMEIPEGAVAPPYLWLAAFLAPLVVIRAIAGLFPGVIRTRVVRWLIAPDVLVFGANTRTAALLATLPEPPHRWRRPVVVVDHDKAALATIAAPGVWKAAGDGASEEALKRTIRRARDIVVITGDNARNSTVTSAVLALHPKKPVQQVSNSEPNSKRPVLFVEVEEPGLARTLEQGGQRVDLETTTFSAAGLAAAAVLDQVGGMDRDDLTPGDDPEDTPPAVALFGTGVLVDAVVLELHHRRRVQLLAQRKKDHVRLRVLIFGPDATQRRDALATLMGAELEVLDLDPLDVELDQVVELTPETVRHLGRHPRLLRVMVLAPTDLDGGGIAVTLARHLGPSTEKEVVLVVESATSPSGDEIDRQTEQSGTLARVRCFRAPDLAYRLPVLQAQRMGQSLARAFYEVDHPQGPSWQKATTEIRQRYDEKAKKATAKRLSPLPSASPDTVAPPALSRTAIVSLDIPEDAPLRALGFDSSVALARAGLHVDFHRLDALVDAGRALVRSGRPEAFGVWGEVARLRESYAALRDDLRPVADRAPREIERLVLLRRAVLGCPDAQRDLRVPALTGREPTHPETQVVVLAGKGDRDATARRLGPTLAQLPVVPTMWATESTRALIGNPRTLRGPTGDADPRWEALLLWSALLDAGHDPTNVRAVVLPGASVDDLIVARTLRAKVGRVVSPQDDDLRDVLLNGSAGIVSLPDDPATIRAFLRPTCWPTAFKGHREPLARELHGRYVERQRDRKPAGDPALRSWSQLSPWLQRSNRAVVDDIPAKLASLGLELVPRERGVPDLKDRFEEHLDALAELEHGRFTAERVLTGWTSGVRNPTRFVTPYLIPWTELTEEVKDYDREVMCDVPEVLALRGLGARQTAR